MKKIGSKTKMTGFSLTLENMEMLDKLVATGKFISRSDTVRQAIRVLYKHEFPYTRQAREDKESHKDRITRMTADEYIAEEFGHLNYVIENEAQGRVMYISNPDPNISTRWGWTIANIKDLTSENIPEPYASNLKK